MGIEHTTVTSYATWANSTVKHFLRNLGNVLKTWHIDEHKPEDSSSTFSSFLQGHVTLHLLHHSHQRSFYSKTDNTKLDCHRQQSTQTFFNTRKSKKTTNVRKPRWNERQTTKHMWKPSINRQATPSRLKSPCCSEGANPTRSSNQLHWALQLRPSSQQIFSIHVKNLVNAD